MKYSKKELIAKVSEKTGYQEENIAEIYEALEETVYDLLLSANEHKDVEIRLFTGFGMFSKLVPSHEKKMPDGEIKTIEPTLKFSARYSARWRKDKIKTTTTTQMKIKKATIDEQGAVYVDGEVVDLINALKNTFEGCIFDLAVTEKTEVPIED